MSSSNFLSNPSLVLVADASVLINLNASGRAADIMQAFPNGFAVTENAVVELASGTRNGHDDERQVGALIEKGLLSFVALSGDALETYGSLIEGNAPNTLDDGEAATIAYAHHSGGLALLDERKARRRCSADFGSLPIACTADLLLHRNAEATLGHQGQIDAILGALQNARMRIPLELIGQVVELIGEQSAGQCPSIPRAWRSSQK